MPTSSEARIRATSTYNLRSRPLPKTRPATGRTNTSTSSRNKENVSQSSTRKLKKSHIPVPVRTKPMTQSKPTDTKGNPADLPKDPKQDGRFTLAGFGNSGASLQKPRRQTLGALPSTYQGRANNTHNTGNHGNILLGSQSVKPGSRKDPLEQEQHKSVSSRKSSLAEQQRGIDIGFEADAGALASILNNTGANIHRQALTRQTIGVPMRAGRSEGSMFTGRQSQGPVRRSIYYQRPRNLNFNQVYTDFANHVLSRLSLAGNVAPSASNQPLERLTKPNVAWAPVMAQPSSKAASQSRLTMSASRRVKTPVTARRVLNPRYQASRSGQESTSSPALRAPPSALKKANSNKAKAQSVKWADVLSPPGERTAAPFGKDELATTLFIDEDTRFMEAYTMNQVMVEQGPLQAACVLAKQDEIHKLEQQAALHRNKLEEMDEIERQLELEIQKLQKEDFLPSPPIMRSEDQTGNNCQSNRNLNSLHPHMTTTHLPQYTLEKAPTEGSVRMPLQGCYSVPGQVLNQSPPKSVNPEAGDTMYRPEGEAPEQSTTAEAFIHSQGSPFQRNPLREESDSGLSMPCTKQPESVPGLDYKTTFGCTGTTSERKFQTLEIPEKPFDEMNRDYFVNKAKSWSEIQDPRMLCPSTFDSKMQAPSELSNKRDVMVHRMHFKQQSNEAVNIRQPSPAIPRGRSNMTETLYLPQEPSNMPSGHLGWNANSFDASQQLVGMSQEHQSATRSGTGLSGNVMTDNQATELFCSLPHNLPRNHNQAYPGSKREEVLSKRITSTQERPKVSQFYRPEFPTPQNKETDLRSQYTQYQCDLMNHQGATSLLHSGPSTSYINPGYSVQQQRANLQLQSNTNKISGNHQTPSREPLSSRGITSMESFRHPLMSTSKDVYPKIPDDHHISWLSSTPAHIQTPRAVKPHSMIKELALKHSLPSVKLPGNNPVPFDRDAPPIQTPLAMRTMSMWNRDAELGASPVQFVSPIALRFGQASSNEVEQTKGTDFIPLQQQSRLMGYPPSATTTTTATSLLKTDTTNLNMHQQQSGLKGCLTSATNVKAFETVDLKPHQQQSGLTDDPTSATTCTATSVIETGSVDLEASQKPQSGFTLEPTPTAPVTDTKQNNNNELHSLGKQLLRSTGDSNSKGQGSLSLGAELMTSGGAAAFLKSKMKPLLTNTTNQLFQEALLDEECALYACRLPSKFSHNAVDQLCFDPVAKILMDGDDMHFVPIQSTGRVYMSSPIGSAFNTYNNFSV